MYPRYKLLSLGIYIYALFLHHQSTVHVFLLLHRSAETCWCSVCLISAAFPDWAADWPCFRCPLMSRVAGRLGSVCSHPKFLIMSTCHTGIFRRAAEENSPPPSLESISSAPEIYDKSN